MTKAIREQRNGNVAIVAEKRIILSMGGKGGVGKTSVMAGLAEWFNKIGIPIAVSSIWIPRTKRGDHSRISSGGRVAEGQYPHTRGA